MAVQCFFLFRHPPGFDVTTIQRTPGNLLRYVCDTTADMTALTNLQDGDRAFCSDTGKRYIRSGDAWVQSTTDNLANTIQDLSGDIFPVANLSDGQFMRLSGGSMVGQTLPAAALSGSYSDLLDKPTIPADQSATVAALQAQRRDIPIYRATASKTVNQNSETSLIPTGVGSLSVLSAVFDTPGYGFEMGCAGSYTGTGIAGLTMKVKIGSQISLQLAGLALPGVTKRFRAVGTGSVRASRVVMSESVFGYDDGTKFDYQVFSSSQLTIGAGDQVVDFTGQWLSIVGSPSITVDQLWLKIIQPPA